MHCAQLTASLGECRMTAERPEETEPEPPAPKEAPAFSPDDDLIEIFKKNEPPGQTKELEDGAPEA